MVSTVNTPVININTAIKLNTASILKEIYFCRIVKIPVENTPNIPETKKASLRFSPCVFRKRVSTTTL
jgi:hypothetical protein